MTWIDMVYQVAQWAAVVASLALFFKDLQHRRLNPRDVVRDREKRRALEAETDALKAEKGLRW